jgi:hypothetical protein
MRHRSGTGNNPLEEMVILAAAESESGSLRHPRAPISGWIMGSMGRQGWPRQLAITLRARAGDHCSSP